MVVLDNGYMRVEIAELGAEIRRVTIAGEERMWNGNPDVWSGVSPVLFPICGGLKDDKYTHNGKEYTMASHGFARRSTFELEAKGENFAVFLLKDSEETLKQYPWHFELRVKYNITSSVIKVEYDVKNTSDSTMYAAVGCHEAYLCPDGIENYDVIFEKKETFKAGILNGKLLTKNWETVLYNSDTLPLYTKFFAKNDSYVFTGIKSRLATLRNRINGRSVSVRFDGFSNFLIWNIPDAPYVCLEPWTGCPSFDFAGYEISEKEGMTAIDPNCRMTKTHTIYFD